MTFEGATSLFDKRVYAQDTEPVDTRNGNLWADTSLNPPVLKVYSADTGAWERASPSNVKVQDTAPNSPGEGDGWVDTSLTPPRLKLYDGASWNFESPVQSVNGQTGNINLKTPKIGVWNTSYSFSGNAGIIGVDGLNGESSNDQVFIVHITAGSSSWTWDMQGSARSGSGSGELTLYGRDGEYGIRTESTTSSSYSINHTVVGFQG